MGNVQNKGQKNELTNFQKRKLKYDFYTFFDLNNDGFLTYNDFLWAKDKICYMSGWKIDSPKYKITEALFHEIWDSLVQIADMDKDGKITKKEWLAMWTVYKRELYVGEEKQKDFLKIVYNHQKKKQQRSPSSTTINNHLDEPNHLGVKSHRSKEGPSPPKSTLNGTKSGSGAGKSQTDDEDDWPLVLDSDEDTPSLLTRRPEKKLPNGEPKSIDEDQVSQDSILEQFAKDHDHSLNLDSTALPKWLYKYLVFRFNLLDRTGDNVIDTEEFEYVLSEFGVSEKIARQAFTIFTENNTKILDFDYFVALFEEFYLSDDPSALGNFINGKLEYSDEDSTSEDEDPGLVDRRKDSSTSYRSMDDDLRAGEGTFTTKAKPEPNGMAKMKQRINSNCCITS